MKINDNLRRASIKPFRSINFRGDVNIRLLDPITRKTVREITGHNMQTDAISLIMATNYDGLINYDELKPIATVLAGGVLAFQNPLTENAANIYPPTTDNNPVIAHAGQTTYTASTDDTTRGLPNAELSGPISNGYKHVWDFPATQGNGTISALALTHKDTGDFWLFGGQNFSPLFPFTQTNLGTFANLDVPAIFNTADRKAYILTVNGTTLTVKTLHDFGIIDDLGLAQKPLYNTETNSILATTKNYTMPQNGYNMRYLYIEEDNELHCLYFSGSTVTRVIIDLTAETQKSDSFTVAGANFAVPAQSNRNVHFYTLDSNGYLYVQGNDPAKTYAFKYSDPTSNPREITASSGHANANLSSIGFGNFGYSPSGAVIIDGSHCRTAAFPGQDFNPDVLAYQQTIFTRVNNSPVWWTPKKTFQNIIPQAVCLNKLYMATVYNLQDPVVKSAAFAMQIEYTLTEISEE